MTRTKSDIIKIIQVDVWNNYSGNARLEELTNVGSKRELTQSEFDELLDLHKDTYDYDGYNMWNLPEEEYQKLLSNID